MHRIVGYFWLIDTEKGRTVQPLDSAGHNLKEWVRSLVKTERAPATVEFITDTTCADGTDRNTADFTTARGGVLNNWGLYDRSNHIRNTNCTGTNVGFVDGHVGWRTFDEMEHRWFADQRDNPSFWW